MSRDSVARYTLDRGGDLAPCQVGRVGPDSDCRIIRFTLKTGRGGAAQVIQPTVAGSTNSLFNVAVKTGDFHLSSPKIVAMALSAAPGAGYLNNAGVKTGRLGLHPLRWMRVGQGAYRLIGAAACKEELDSQDQRCSRHDNNGRPFVTTIC